MNEARCPYCGAVIEFEDVDTDFTEFEDCGECLIATMDFECQCGEQLRIEAQFEYSGKLRIR